MSNLKIVRSGTLHAYDKEESTLVVRWDITGRCPYKCSYCYEGENPAKRKIEPSLEDMVKAMPKLSRIVPAQKKLHFALFGGEPTAHRDFFPFITELHTNFPDAEISCLSNLFHNIDFLKKLYNIVPDFIYNVSVHFEYFSEKIWEKISFLAAQKRKGTIFLQFLPSERKNVRELAQRIRDTYPEFLLEIQFLRSRESNFRHHFSEYTEDDYIWARQFMQQQELPVYFIDYIDENLPGKIFRRTFTFLDAFHTGLSNFQGAHCTFSMQRLTILLNGNLQTNFCLPTYEGGVKENIYRDTSWPQATATLLRPAVCIKEHCACRGMRDAAKWFDPRFAPVYFGGDPALAHDAVAYEELPLPQ